MNTSSVKDVLNAINNINKNGVILFHDFIPIDWEENVPRFTEGWSGDVWKVARTF